jgi:predicted PurR-regulated permease PerM
VAPPNGRETGPAPPATDLAEFARRVAVAVLIAVLLLGIVYVLWRGVHVLLQAFAGVLFALFLTTLSDWLSRRTRLSYGWALGGVVLGLLMVTGAMGWFLSNSLAAQFRDLSRQLPQSLEQLRDYLGQYEWGRLLLQDLPEPRQIMAWVGEFSRVSGFLQGAADFLVAGVLILVVGIFGAAEPDLYRAGLLHLVPPAQRRRVSEAMEALVFNLRGWLVGQIFLMIVIGLTTVIGLELLGVPLALSLGLIAAILEMVPYVGAWIAAVPAVLVALLVSPAHAVLTGGLYLGLHVLEGYVLLPLVQRRAVHLPPALTLVMQVLLADLLGLMGLFVAAPLTVCLVVLLKMLYVEDTLGDRTVHVAGEPGKMA